MTSPKRYDRIAFVASASTEAQQALTQLTQMYGNVDPDDADVVVALGGDGLMLQTLHAHMHSGKPIYGMNRGTVGFLMNEISSHELHARLAAALEPSAPEGGGDAPGGNGRYREEAHRSTHLWRKARNPKFKIRNKSEILRKKT